MNKAKQSKNQTVKASVKTNEKKIIHPVNYALAIAVAIVGFILFANTIGHDYVLDDSGAILENRFVQAGFHGIPDLLKVDFWHFSNVHLGYYRPLSLITFAIEYHFFPSNPHVSHFINVLIFALSGLMLFIVLSKIFNSYNSMFAFAISLLYIAHPIHTEIVANIKGRDELLSFFNVMAMFWLALLYIDKKKLIYLISSLVFCYLAMLSKETALTGVLLLPVIFYYYKNISIADAIKKTIPFAIAALLFFVQKKNLLGTLSGIIPDDIVNYPYTQSKVKLPTTFMLFLFCLRLLVFPHPLRYDYSFNQIPAVTISNGFALIGMILLFAGIYYTYKQAIQKTTIGFALSIFFITLIPSLAFTILRGGIFAERFLFFPSLGFCIAIVYYLFMMLKINFIEKSNSVFGWIKTNFKFTLLLIVVSFLYSVKTISRNLAWKDNLTLFSTDIKTGEDSAQNQRHYGNQFIAFALKEKNPEKRKEYANIGIAAMRQSLHIYPKFGESFNQIGVMYEEVFNNNDSAIYYYNKAIETAPGYAYSYYNIGTVYQGMGKNNVASFYYNEAIKYNPTYLDAQTARDNLKKATGLDIHLNPLTSMVDTTTSNKDTKYFYDLGNYYASQGDYIKASQQFTKSIELNANAENAYINLANCYGTLKQYDKSIEIITKLLSINPKNISAYDNLAVTYKLMGNIPKSEEYAEKANKLRGN